MKRIHSLAALSLAALCVAGTAGAQTSASRLAPDTGPYIGLGAGLTKFSLKKNDFTATGATSRAFDEKDKGFKIFGGYRLLRNLAVEAQYARLGEAEVRYSGAGFAPGREKYEVSGFSVAAVGLLPVSDEFTLFAKAGPSFTRAENTFSRTGLGTNTKSSRAGGLFGLGASYKLSENFSLRAEFENFSRVGEASKAGRSSVNLLSIGAAYNF